MKFLITGHGGFIGQNLLKEVYKRYGNEGHQLIEKEDVEELINDTRKLDEIVSSVDVILHNGAISSTDNEDYKEIMPYNVLFSKRLIDSAADCQKKIIFASSASIYGNGDYIPQNLYAWSKLITEDYGRAEYSEGFTALRYFNVYGPHEEHKYKMASVGYQAWNFRNAWKGQEQPYPYMLFPKEPKRDFVYVKDVVSANFAAIEAPCGIYDVGLGVANRFEDFVSNMGVKYSHLNEEVIPEWYQFFTQSDEKRWLPNWKPEYGLEKGCNDYLEYLENE